VHIAVQGKAYDPAVYGLEAFGFVIGHADARLCDPLGNHGHIL
jgi:hypothetical protein